MRRGDRVIQEAQLRKLGYRDYRSYLRSPHWQQRKRNFWDKYLRCCCVCRSTVKIEIHHLRYSNLGHEPDEDLRGLCRRCHTRAHSYIIWPENYLQPVRGER